MAAKTTVKVATLTGAAKDDNLLSSVTGVNEDHLSGNLNVLANDPGSAHLYSLKQDVSGLAGSATFPAVSTAFSAAGATISINADGTIAYDASNLNLQHLAEGVAYTDSFTYTVQMANGAYSTAVAHVELMGVNDAPTLAAIAAATINDTAADDTPAPITGTLVGADVDDGAVLTYAVTGTSALGVVAVDGANYSFTADANAIDALQQGESATATFTATVTDEHGASASRTMEFTLIGANDTAEFGGVATGSVTEDGPLTTGAIVTVADRDHDQSGFQAASAAALTGNHGTFSFNEATGAWGYSLNNADSAVQGLWSGETLTETLTVSSIDGSTQNIVVTIHGTDDAAVFGGAVTGGVTEDGTLTTGGTVTVSDLDHDQSAFQAATPAALTGAHGTFTFAAATGAWGYTLNNADAAVQALNTGASLSDTLTVSSIDGSTQDIVVTINGADEPVVVPPTDVVPPAVVSHDVMVNRGLQVENGRVLFNDFASTDTVHYANNLTKGAVSQIDYIADPAHTVDSTQVQFSYQNGNGPVQTFEVVLVGYTGTVHFLNDALV
jgi:VCBS repeat-containing protein